MNATATSALVASAMLATGALVSGQASATEDKFYIQDVQFNGTGCTSDDSILVTSPVGDPRPDQFSLIFRNYIVQSGPGTKPSDWNKNCNINVYLHIPHGYRFSIAEVHYLGFADLPYGVSGTQTSSYQFLFFSNRVRLSSTFKGYFLGDYEFTDKLKFVSLVWSPCGIDAVPLNIATRMYLTGPRAYKAALLQTDQIDGHVEQVYRFVWQTCV